MQTAGSIYFNEVLRGTIQGPILSWFKPMANISTQQTPESLNYIILTMGTSNNQQPIKTVTLEMRKREHSIACTNITSKNSYTPATVQHRRGN